MAGDSEWIWQIDRRIPSDPVAGVKLIHELLDALTAHCWDDEHEVWGIHLALEEAIMNAIKHGNALDDSKQVHVIAKLSDTRFYIKITDEGVGFDPGEVPDPTLDENLEQTSGRGLALIKHYMTRVDYHAPGNTVEMEKLRGK